MLEGLKSPPFRRDVDLHGTLEHKKKNFFKFAIKWEGRIQRYINIMPICIYLIFLEI